MMEMTTRSSTMVNAEFERERVKVVLQSGMREWGSND